MNREQLEINFPILNSTLNGHKLSYLDSANTSLTPEPVLAAMNAYYREYNANIHRGIYPLSEQATARHEEARATVQVFLNAASPKEIIFTRNATEALNLFAKTWGKEHLKKGDAVVLSLMEHHSNIVPWQLLQKEREFEILYIEIDETGQLDQDQYESFLNDHSVKLVSLTAVSNTLGTIPPLKEMIRKAHEQGAKVFVDACQAAPHIQINVQDLDADGLTFTGHKVCGPTGIGVLYAKEEILADMPPFLGGGEMIRSVTTEGSTWNDLPYKFEAGTPNIAGAIGLGAALEFLKKIGKESILSTEQELLVYAHDQLAKIPGITIFGPQDPSQKAPVISFAIAGVHPHDIATILGEENICIRAGNHCAQPLMNSLKVPATARMSFAFYNTREDIDRAVKGLIKAQDLFS